jgi:DNA polymerase-3 subunit delta'
MSFKNIIGHEWQKKLLAASIEKGRMAHAYLFSGPRGAGKFSLAREFAKALLCESPINGDSCEKCASCRKIESGNHPDFTFAGGRDDPAIKIEAMRELMRLSAFQPFEAQRKICVIPDAERMTDEAQNAFLKTLEEPPGKTIFLLTSSGSGDLLETIISRCQKVRLSKIGEEQIINYLIAARGAARENAATAAALSGGSIGRALGMLDGETLSNWQKARKIW